MEQMNEIVETQSDINNASNSIDFVKGEKSENDDKNEKDRGMIYHSSNRNSNSNENNASKRKRPFESHRPQAKDRMCNSVEKGISCPFPDTCSYCHDPLG